MIDQAQKAYDKRVRAKEKAAKKAKPHFVAIQYERPGGPYYPVARKIGQSVHQEPRPEKALYLGRG